MDDTDEIMARTVLGGLADCEVPEHVKMYHISLEMRRQELVRAQRELWRAAFTRWASGIDWVATLGVPKLRFRDEG